MRRRSPKSPARAKQPEPDINITPLVDVVLVLLIIFMVVAPALNNDLVRLPTIQAADPKPKDEDALELTLTKDGHYLYQEQRLDKDALGRELRAAREAAAGRQLLLKTDIEVPYERVRATLGLLQDIGFKGVSLKVEERARGERP
ncbi:MAG: biopolymer transporter ExbD [Polyangiaceae bacterium]|nr:biopolymer transporter ExbD [Polyangiaceae bacterium]MCW5789481.1 biopolymer transporter ExbD [Polyangiaceae bacterium]